MKNALKRIFTALFGCITIVCACFSFGGCSFYYEYETRYETEVSFYVNPKKAGESDSESQYGVYGTYGKALMNNMLGLLESDAFVLLLLQSQDLAPSETLQDGSQNPAFQEWEKTYEYTRYFVGAKEGIEYSYIGKTESEEGTVDRSFIEVKISVAERELAEIFLKAITQTLPPFVEENMAVPNGYEGTTCRKVSLFEEIVETKRKINKNFII